MNTTWLFQSPVGLNTSLVPMYISEIAPLNLRGGLGTVNQLGVTVGILFSQILGIQEILGTETGWPLLLGKRSCLPTTNILLYWKQTIIKIKEKLKKLGCILPFLSRLSHMSSSAATHSLLLLSGISAISTYNSQSRRRSQNWYVRFFFSCQSIFQIFIRAVITVYYTHSLSLSLSLYLHSFSHETIEGL